MARKIKNPVVVTMSKRLGEKLFRVLHAAADDARRTASNREHARKLADIVATDIDSQVGGRFTMELRRKDALEMHRAALYVIQSRGDLLTVDTYTRIEKAFRDAYDARLRG